MIGIFKQKTPANILILVVFGILVKLPLFTDPRVPVPSNTNGELYAALLRWLEPYGNANPIIYSLLSFGFLFLQAIILTRFINNQRMMSKATYLPGMAYLLITSLLPDWSYFSAALIVNSLLLFVLTSLFSTYNQYHAKSTIFNIGLALGIAGFLLVSSLTFVIWVLLALAVMRPFRLNEWLLCLLGITTPFYFYAIYIFFFDQFSLQNILPHFDIGIPLITQTAWLAGAVFLLMVPFLVGGYYVQDNLRRMLIQVRKGWSLLLLYLLTSLLIPFINHSDNFSNWVMALVPMAAFHACAYLYTTLRIFAVLMFWLSLAFVVGYQYFGPGW